MIKAPLVTRGIIRQSLRKAPKPIEYSFLIYHRVDGGLPLELDIAPGLFRRQMAFLSAAGSVISYDAALHRLAGSTCVAGSGTILTFDDGYEDFYTQVFPILRQYELPAMLFVTTGFVDEGIPYPMLSNPDSDVKPVTWAMLGEMAESGLVTLGAHTHTHPVLTELTNGQIEEELVRSLDLFERRSGFQPRHFAYPRAVATGSARALVEQYFASAVVGGGRRVTPAYV